jgi:hypothetical protein
MKQTRFWLMMRKKTTKGSNPNVSPSLGSGLMPKSIYFICACVIDWIWGLQNFHKAPNHFGTNKLNKMKAKLACVA